MEIMSGGSRRVVFDVDNFTIKAASGTVAPFTYDAGLGAVLIDNAFIRNLTADSIDVESIDIANANISNLVVGTSNLDFDSVTDRITFSGSGAAPNASDTWSTVATQVINNPNPNPVFMQYSISQVAGRIGSGGAFSMQTRVYRAEGAKQLFAISASLSSGPGSVAASDAGFYMDEDPVQGTNTYHLQVKTSTSPTAMNSPSPSSSCTLKMVWWKR